MTALVDVLTIVTWAVLPAVVVVVALRRMHAAGSHAVGGAVASFGVAGLAVAGLALTPSVGDVAERAFAPHMAQHLVLGLMAPLLIVVGRVPELVPWAVAGPRRRMVRRALGPFGRPPSSVALPTVAMVTAWYAWHVPALYGAAVASPAVHALEHLSILGIGCWYWAAVAPHRRRTGSVVLASFTVMFALGFLGAILSLSPVAFYGGHVRATTVAAQLDDQHLGGLLMWTPGGLVYLIAAVFQLVRWLEVDGDDRRVPLITTGGGAPL